MGEDDRIRFLLERDGLKATIAWVWRTLRIYRAAVLDSYPGRGNGGDLLPRIELTLLVGQHAQLHFLGRRRKPSLAETVRAWRQYAPQYIPLPHPSPRNQPWFKRHPWFERQLVPGLQARIKALSAPFSEIGRGQW